MSTSKGKLTVQELLDLVTSMNEHDKTNLEFLLTLSPNGYARWWIQASDDDLIYADQLLGIAVNEIQLKLMEDQMDKVEDTKEAQEILKKFQLR